MGFFTTHAQDRAEALQQAYNDGQSDAAKGVNNPPGWTMDDVIGGEAREDRDAYRSGQDAQSDKK